jgi:hypothetical protein
LEAADFADRDHLSPAGAQKFSRFFSDWLKRTHPELVESVRNTSPRN